MELDGVQSELTSDFYSQVWDELRAQGIPLTFHWGKIHDLDDTKVRNAYSANRDRWVQARNKLLAPEALKVFSSPPLRKLGLDEVL